MGPGERQQIFAMKYIEGQSDRKIGDFVVDEAGGPAYRRRSVSGENPCESVPPLRVERLIFPDG